MKTQIEKMFAEVDSALAEKKEEMSRFENMIEIKRSKIKELEAGMPELEKALEKIHLQVTKVSAYKSGSKEEWCDGDSLVAYIHMEPTPDEKFKKIKFEGYTSSGSGKNNSKLKKKASMIENHLMENTPFKALAVNEFSLETSRENESSTVLMCITL